MAQVTLFYDADCGFCQGSVEWLLARALPDTFDPVAYQDESALRKFPMVDRTLADKGIQALGSDAKLRRKAEATGYCLTFVPR
jgi:predicted DCC family thiol-disulfide oxidoreductase YuxK